MVVRLHIESEFNSFPMIGLFFIHAVFWTLILESLKHVFGQMIIDQLLIVGIAFTAEIAYKLLKRNYFININDG